MQLKIHVFCRVFNTFRFLYAVIVKCVDDDVAARATNVNASVHQKIQFMYTLSCCGELTPFCRLPKYSLTSCLLPELVCAHIILLAVARRSCTTHKCRQAGSFDFTLCIRMKNPTEPIIFFSCSFDSFSFVVRFFMRPNDKSKPFQNSVGWVEWASFTAAVAAIAFALEMVTMANN